MASSSKCLFLVFLCLVVLLTSESTKADHDRTRHIVQGPCEKFPDCNQHCLEVPFIGGKCIKLSPDATSLTCICFG
ncbi:hypothetical protein EUTSA_v10023953mg [Eutrema salsugineum]|uniref:Knottin scorpion toxin-like domain-containing protein n=1 Tax=Eutrema salsugineum TaxID=72664 RepID=V4JV44_EUTSA|nr:hypothetical protein EUTSA_v10023953mg [Eutrema salsugineum]